MLGNPIHDKSYQFAIDIVLLYRRLVKNQKEFVLSKQLLRSGTAIGALVKEAEHAQSKSDFLNKMNIALKEANETEYWLNLLVDTKTIQRSELCNLQNDCAEILKILIAFVKSTKKSLGRQ